jgi:hypothetical protein
MCVNATVFDTLSSFLYPSMQNVAVKCTDTPQTFLFRNSCMRHSLLGHHQSRPVWVSQTCSILSSHSPLSLKRLAVIADTLHALEILSSVNQSALVVLAGVDEIGIEEGKLD